MEAIKRVYASTFSSARQGLCAGHTVSPGRRKDGGDPAAGGGGDPWRSGSIPIFPAWCGRTISIPSRPMNYSDGIAAVALGLGRAVVDGGQVSNVLSALSRQLCSSLRWKTFWPTRSGSSGRWSWTTRSIATDPLADLREVQFGLDAAESDGTLHRLGFHLFRRQSHGV